MVRFENRTCEETLDWDVTTDTYVRCGAPAVVLVKHRGRNEGPYYMCRPCGTHNVQNRDAELLADQETAIRALVRLDFEAGEYA